MLGRRLFYCPVLIHPKHNYWPMISANERLMNGCGEDSDAQPESVESDEMGFDEVE